MLYFADIALSCKSTVKNDGASNGEEFESKSLLQCPISSSLSLTLRTSDVS